MGAWGDSIFADDDAQDVYHHYRRIYNQGKEHAEVRQELERAWADSIADSDDGPIFWFAVARAQWEFGALDADVLCRVEEIAEMGLGLDRWREGGPRMLAKREKVVREFLEKIRQPNPKPKKRKVEKRYPPIYQPGDCLAIELCDGSFGAVIVLAVDDAHHTEGFDKVAFLEWHAQEVPPLSFYEERRWLGAKRKGWVRPGTISCFARFHRQMKNRIQRVGQVSLRKDDPKCKGLDRTGGWDNVSSDLEEYYGLRR
jgi:hypothetical protein